MPDEAVTVTAKACHSVMMAICKAVVVHQTIDDVEPSFRNVVGSDDRDVRMNFSHARFPIVGIVANGFRVRIRGIFFGSAEINRENLSKPCIYQPSKVCMYLYSPQMHPSHALTS